MADPRITVAIPSFNQGAYLDQALQSVFSQDISAEVYVVDGGSTDNSLEVIRRWEPRLAGWRSHQDTGQAAAINEGISQGSAEYVCWLNSDDFYYPGAFKALLQYLEASEGPAVYGKCWNVSESGEKSTPYLTMPFRELLLANYCFIAQPSTLIRRSAWEAVGGLDESLHLALDYDLWWKLYRRFGKFAFCGKFLAANRVHPGTKTRNSVDSHYRESISVVTKYYGRTPLKWRLLLPIMRMVRNLQGGVD